MDLEDIGNLISASHLLLTTKIIVLARLYNKNTEEAQKLLDHYKQIFYDREKKSLLINTNIKRVNQNFWKNKKNLKFTPRSRTQIFERFFKKPDFSKGFEEMNYLKKSNYASHN